MKNHFQLVRMPWEPGILRGQIPQRDLFPPMSRHPAPLRQILRHRIIELYLTAPVHLERQQGSKYFGHGTDFKDGISVDLLVGAVIQLSSRKHPPATRV